MPTENGEAVFQQAMKASNDFETRGVSWRYNDIWYRICVAECVLSNDQCNLFGYRRLDFDNAVHYDEISSEESGVDTSKTAKAAGSCSTSITQTQAKGPAGKTAAKVATSVTPGLLVVAPSFAKANTRGRAPHGSPPTTALTNVSTGKALSTTSTAKASPRVAKTSSTKGKAAKVTPRPASSIARLPLAATSTLRKLSESHMSDSSPGNAVSERTRKKTNANEITDEEWIVVRE